jgi:hypothetical protein
MLVALDSNSLLATPPPKEPAMRADQEEFTRRVVGLHAQVRQKKLALSQAKVPVKQARRALDEAEAERDALLSERADAQLPLPRGPGTAWQATPLAEALAGVPATVLQPLEGAGLTTAGKLADFANGGGRLRDVAGALERTLGKQTPEEPPSGDRPVITTGALPSRSRGGPRATTGSAPSGRRGGPTPPRGRSP